MKVFDNVTNIVRDDMEKTIKRNSKVSVAAACFSMYAYRELKKQLESIDEFRFIFTSPTFVTEKAKKQKREFYIPRLTREQSLYGTEFEIKLRNEMTQKQLQKSAPTGSGGRPHLNQIQPARTWQDSWLPTPELKKQPTCL